MMYPKYAGKAVMFILILALPLLWGCSKAVSQDPSPTPEPEPTPTVSGIYGYVLDTEGKPFEGVVMSDGYKFTVTDAKGYWQMDNYRFAAYIQCSLPSEAVITTGGTYNLPQCHYQRLSSKTKRYDFTFTRQSAETKFRLLALGDPQVKNETQISQYRQTALQDIKSYVSDNKDIPTYGISLGDNVANVWGLFPSIATVLGEMPVPIFAAIGNHDHEFPTSGEAASREKYEAVFGPSNYSFNRGNVHIVVIDNVLHEGLTSGGYSEGCESWQYDWLKNDLSYVSTDKSIFVVAHIPVTDTVILRAVSPFAEARIVCGHTHKVQNTHDVAVDGKKIYICAAGSTGAPWKGLILSDGCQRGYKVYDYDGAKLSREIYKSIQYPESFQMRMFRTYDFPAFYTQGGDKISFAEYGGNIIAVNLFNYKASDGWSVSVSENGVPKTSSFRCTVSNDVWATKFLIEKMSATGETGKNGHMLYFTLQDKDAAITVTARDKWGNTFTQDTFTTEKDIPDYPENL